MLQLKLSTKVADNRTSIALKDTTGLYNLESNPGGWGGTNFPLSTTNQLIIRYQALPSLASIYLDFTGTARATTFFSGGELVLTPQDIDPLSTKTQFDSGQYILEWFTSFGYTNPQNQNSTVTVNTVNGSTTINLAVGSEVTSLLTALQPRAGIFRADLLPAIPFFLIDMSKPYSETQASLAAPYDNTGTAILSPVISVAAYLGVNDEVDVCVQQAVAALAQDNSCGCNDEKVDQTVFMTILKFGMDINQACGNYQGAQDIRTALLAMCNCKCGCS